MVIKILVVMIVGLFLLEDAFFFPSPSVAAVFSIFLFTHVSSSLVRGHSLLRLSWLFPSRPRAFFGFLFFPPSQILFHYPCWIFVLAQLFNFFFAFWFSYSLCFREFPLQRRPFTTVSRLLLLNST